MRTCPWATWCQWAAPWLQRTLKATWPSCPTPQGWAPPQRQTKTRMTTKITILSSLLSIPFFFFFVLSNSLTHTHSYTHSFNVIFNFLSWSYGAALSRGETLYHSAAGNANPVVHCVFIFYIFHFLKSNLLSRRIQRGMFFNQSVILFRQLKMAVVASLLFFFFSFLHLCHVPPAHRIGVVCVFLFSFFIFALFFLLWGVVQSVMAAFGAQTKAASWGNFSRVFERRSAHQEVLYYRVIYWQGKLALSELDFQPLSQLGSQAATQTSSVFLIYVG